MAERLSDFSRLCIHTFTTKPWSLAQAVEGYQRAGVPGITVWRQTIDPLGAKEAGRMLRESGLEVVSLCRGGFFPAADVAARQAALDDNRRAIEEAEEIGAPLIVLVCGSDPGLPLVESRKQIAEGIAAILPEAEAAGIKLGIEPLHPMYADAKSAVNTVGQANDMIAEIGSPHVGVTVDVYHVWWDPNIDREIARAGDSIFSFHVCDWRTPTRDLLTDRGLMGEGCIDIRGLREAVEKTGFNGAIEVEIFSEEFWGMDQAEYVEKIKEAYLTHC